MTMICMLSQIESYLKQTQQEDMHVIILEVRCGQENKTLQNFDTAYHVMKYIFINCVVAILCQEYC